VVIRALAWLGPEEVEDGLDAVLPRLSGEDLEEFAAARAVMPRWMAEPLSARLAHEKGSWVVAREALKQHR
jgi:hypothetical protein